MSCKMSIVHTTHTVLAIKTIHLQVSTQPRRAVTATQEQNRLRFDTQFTLDHTELVLAKHFDLSSSMILRQS